MCQKKVFLLCKNSLIKTLSCSFSRKIRTKFPSDCKVSAKLLEFQKLNVQYEASNFKSKRPYVVQKLNIWNVQSIGKLQIQINMALLKITNVFQQNWLLEYHNCVPHKHQDTILCFGWLWIIGNCSGLLGIYGDCWEIIFWVGVYLAGGGGIHLLGRTNDPPRRALFLSLFHNFLIILTTWNPFLFSQFCYFSQV